ncbi:hypothetical protein MMPV_003857 [Pyropia vietnamensis]
MRRRSQGAPPLPPAPRRGSADSPPPPAAAVACATAATSAAGIFSAGAAAAPPATASGLPGTRPPSFSAASPPPEDPSLALVSRQRARAAGWLALRAESPAGGRRRRLLAAAAARLGAGPPPWRRCWAELRGSTLLLYPAADDDGGDGGEATGVAVARGGSADGRGLTDGGRRRRPSADASVADDDDEGEDMEGGEGERGDERHRRASAQPSITGSDTPSSVAAAVIGRAASPALVLTLRRGATVVSAAAPNLLRLAPRAGGTNGGGGAVLLLLFATAADAGGWHDALLRPHVCPSEGGGPGSSDGGGGGGGGGDGGAGGVWPTDGGDGRSRMWDVDVPPPSPAVPSTTRWASAMSNSSLQAMQPRSAPPPLSPAAFETKKLLGSGSSGNVFLVAARDTGELFAMKVIPKASLTSSPECRRHALDERLVMEVTRPHPFVLPLRYAFQSPRKLYMVMEYAAGGDLYSFLRRRGRSLGEAATRFILAELVLGLEHLHSSAVVYRDLKLENILLTSSGHVRIADFGLSKLLSDEGAGLTKTLCGTRHYCAPEAVAGHAYGQSCDVWSLGVLAYELLCGQTPFHAEEINDVFVRILTADVEYPSHLTPTAISLISGLLTRPLASRLGCGPGGWADVRAHPFFATIDWAVAARGGLVDGNIFATLPTGEEHGASRVRQQQEAAAAAAAAQRQRQRRRGVADGDNGGPAAGGAKKTRPRDAADATDADGRPDGRPKPSSARRRRPEAAAGSAAAAAIAASAGAEGSAVGTTSRPRRPRRHIVGDEVAAAVPDVVTSSPARSAPAANDEGSGPDVSAVDAPPPDYDATASPVSLSPARTSRHVGFADADSGSWDSDSSSATPEDALAAYVVDVDRALGRLSMADDVNVGDGDGEAGDDGGARDEGGRADAAGDTVRHAPHPRRGDGGDRGRRPPGDPALAARTARARLISELAGRPPSSGDADPDRHLLTEAARGMGGVAGVSSLVSHSEDEGGVLAADPTPAAVTASGGRGSGSASSSSAPADESSLSFFDAAAAMDGRSPSTASATGADVAARTPNTWRAWNKLHARGGGDGPGGGGGGGCGGPAGADGTPGAVRALLGADRAAAASSSNSHGTLLLGYSFVRKLPTSGSADGRPPSSAAGSAVGGPTPAFLSREQPGAAVAWRGGRGRLADSRPGLLGRVPHPNELW